MSHHSERDLLNELFPGTARELFGERGVGRTGASTLGLFPVADGKVALVSGEQLVELEPVDPAGKSAQQCDLCHITKSRGEVGIYRAESERGRASTYRYVTLCLSTKACQERAGRSGLTRLASRLLGVTSG